MAHSNADLVREGFAAFKRGDLAPIEAMLDPNVEWRWIEPGDWDCHSREEVLRTIRDRLDEGFGDNELVEVIEAGDRVLVGVRGENLEAAGAADGEHYYNVFTFRGGKVIDIQDYARRDEAVAAIA